jgi:hypothetical protein
MARMTALGLFALIAAGMTACASESPSGSAPPATRSTDPLNPVDAFPQVRGPYMRQ